jgi:hypothetical protein
VLVGLFASRGGLAYSALSMGSVILWDGILSKKVVWRGDLGTINRVPGTVLWLAAGRAPVPNASRVGGSVERESGLKSPIAFCVRLRLTTPLPRST